MHNTLTHAERLALYFAPHVARTWLRRFRTEANGVPWRLALRVRVAELQALQALRHLKPFDPEAGREAIGRSNVPEMESTMNSLNTVTPTAAEPVPRSRTDAVWAVSYVERLIREQLARLELAEGSREQRVVRGLLAALESADAPQGVH